MPSKPGSRRKTSRLMYIKIRVVITEPMPKARAIQKVERTIDSGVVQPGIEIGYVDWKRGKGMHARSGTYLDRKAVTALRDFWSVLHDIRSDHKYVKKVKAHPRTAIVRKGDR